MNKKIFITFFLTFSLLSAPFFARADFNSTKEEYTKLLGDHTNALTEYKTAKNTYETYKTLSSQTTAIQKAKNYLEIRDKLLIKHFELLIEKINESSFVDNLKKESLRQVALDEIAFYNNHKDLLTAVATISDVNTLAKKAEEQIKLSNIRSKQILGNILIAKVNNLKIPYSELSNLFSAEINSIKARGLKNQSETDKLERWLLEVNNKKILSDTNTIQNLNQLDKLGANNYDIEKTFDETRVSIIQGYLYLKEGTNYMKEILEEIKYN